MLHLRKRIVAVLAACLTTSYIALPANGAVGANPALSRDVTATLTAKHGTVFKREFRDWNREEWGEPAPCEVSDQLREGMQIGTGNESWAEVTWPNVKTRAWANTVFAVAPNKRLVYLTGGEMLFRLDKHRKDKDDYYIWTKVLQARIRGTTVLVQAKGPVTRFTVMEGTVEVTNRLDKSRAVLHPGAVWEVKGYNLSKRSPMPSVNESNSQGDSNYKPAPLAVPKSFDSAINEITYDSINYLPVFQDKYASSNVYASNKDALLNHPLISVGETIDSLPLIQDAQRDLPGFNKMLPIKLADNARLTKVISSAVELTCVPTKANYFIGQSIGREVKMPATVGELQPDGLVMNPATLRAAKASPATALVTPRTAMPTMIVGPVLERPEGDVQKDGASVFDEDPVPLPQMQSGRTPDPMQSSQVPSLVPNTCLTPNQLNPVTSTSAFQPLPGAVTPNVLPTINGVLTPATASVTQTLTPGATVPLANTVNAVTNQLPINAVNSALTNTLGGVRNNLNNLLGR